MTIGIIIGIVVILFFLYDRNSKRKMKERFDEYQYNKPPPDVDEIKRNLGFNISEKFNDDNLDDYNSKYKRFKREKNKKTKEFFRMESEIWTENYNYGKNLLEKSIGVLNGQKCSVILKHLSKEFEHGRDIDTPDLDWTIDIIEPLTLKKYPFISNGSLKSLPFFEVFIISFIKIVISFLSWRRFSPFDILSVVF